MKQRIEGTIVDCSQIVQYTKTDGTAGVSCMIHVKSNDQVQYPMEVAVKATGDMTRFATCVGQNVVIEYVVRVFSYVRDGIKCLANDIFATHITNQSK